MIFAAFGATSACAEDMTKVREKMTRAFGPNHKVLLPGEKYKGGSEKKVHCLGPKPKHWHVSEARLVKGWVCGHDGKMKKP